MAFNGITLYYIPSMNGVDTVYFDDLSDQEKWFQNVRHRLEIESSYYPPLFDNVLTLSSDYFNWGDDKAKPFSNAWNYLSLTSSQGKTFYYFINDISYVSEDMVSVSIRMDTIQSYMFDMRLTRPFITRKAIKRWNDDGTINRDFIRENLSTGEMVLKNVESHESYSQKNGIYWFLIKASASLLDKNITKVDFNPASSGDVFYSESAGTYTFGLSAIRPAKFFPIVGYYYLVPIANKKIYLIDPNDSSKKYLITPNFLGSVITDSRVESISLVDTGLFERYIYTVDDDDSINLTLQYNYSLTTDERFYPFGLLSTLEPSISGFSYYGGFFFIGRAELINDNYIEWSNLSLGNYLEVQSSFNVKKSDSSKGANLFDPSYVPAMVDEQYYAFTLRYNGQEITAPYHYATRPTATSYVFPDLEGNVYALTTIDNDFSSEGKCQSYLGTPVSVGAPQMQLYTDPWKDYRVNHQGSYITDWIASALGASGSMAKSIGSGILIAESSGNRDRYAQNYQARTEAIQNQASALGGMSQTLGEYVTGFNTLIEKMPKTNIMRDAKTGRFVKVQ